MFLNVVLHTFIGCINLIRSPTPLSDNYINSTNCTLNSEACDNLVANSKGKTTFNLKTHLASLTTTPSLQINYSGLNIYKYHQHSQPLLETYKTRFIGIYFSDLSMSSGGVILRKFVSILVKRLTLSLMYVFSLQLQRT